MIVVADTSPLNYLILISSEGILPVLFGRVVIPGAVFAELSSPHAPVPVKTFLASPPEWLVVQPCPRVDPELRGLGLGEQEAITLALEVKAGLVLLDEAPARQRALQRSLGVVGTLGVLERAAARGLVNLDVALDRLQKTSFRISPKLIALVKKRAQQ